jgi:DNA-binding winged helix-turn-helix (wHTH) protein/tetratricopeptide (TPR) repeat protein
MRCETRDDSRLRESSVAGSIHVFDRLESWRRPRSLRHIDRVIYCFGDFEFEQERLQLRKAGRPVKAEAIAMRVLDTLLQRAGEVVTKDELVDEVWEGRAVADNVITVAMARLRRALKTERADDEFVLTVYGRGYRFVAPVVLRAMPEPESSIAASGERRAANFVGRERVLERLEQALGDARQGRGRMCVLIGEAGIGKTRAVEMLEQKLVGSSVRVAWGFCREVGDTPPLWPFRRLLREVVATSSAHGRTLAPTLASLDELLRPLEGQSGEGELAENALQPQQTARHRSFELFARAFSEAAKESAWVLVLDDLHRADAASLELLGYLIDEVAHERILIVATLRHASGRRSPRPGTHLPYVLGHRNCERIALERLRERDVASYLAPLIDDLDGRLASAVYAHSEGNPFFMTELVRQLEDMERPSADRLVVSDVALDLIRQRIDKLEPASRQLLAAAAVIGRTFELSLLQAVTARDPSELMVHLDRAIAADLVVAAPESTTAFAFGHVLIRTVLYDALAPAEQRAWHIRTASALEMRAEHGESVAPSELAYHLHAALPESDLRKTVAYCRAASAAAASVYAHPDVVRYLLHALEALGLMEKPSVRLRMSMWYLIALYSLGMPLSHKALSEVVRLAKEQGNALMLVRAAIMLNAYPGLKPMRGARAALEEAVPLVGSEPPALRSVMLGSLACTAPDCFSRERCERLSEQASELARQSGSRAARYVSLVVELNVKGGPEYEESAQHAADQLTRLHGPQLTPRMAVAPTYVALFRSVSALQRGDVAQMTSAIQHGLTHAREIRSVLAWHFRRFQAVAAVNRGALAEAVPTLMMLQRNADRDAAFWMEPFCAFDRIVIFRELAEAPPVLDDALRTALDYDAAEPPGVWSLKVRALATAGLREEALAALSALTPNDLAKLPCDSQYLGTLGHLAHAALQLGALDYAAALYPLLARFPKHFAAHYAFLSDAVPQLLSRLCSALERPAEALEHARAALVMNERVGFVRSTVESQLELSRCLLTSSASTDREHALGLAREAQRTAARLGMRLSARAASALLRRTEA